MCAISSREFYIDMYKSRVARIIRNWTDDGQQCSDSETCTRVRHLVHAAGDRTERRGETPMKQKETKRREEKKKKEKRSFVAVPSVDEGKGSEKERAHVCVNARGIFFAAA